ncbi:MAG: hypothetical protein OEV94_05510 [Deltaproteobacteria bacterium]|nr:hypothetical protein [Deltaproteobacteria bacterium]
MVFDNQQEDPRSWKREQAWKARRNAGHILGWIVMFCLAAGPMAWANDSQEDEFIRSASLDSGYMEIANRPMLHFGMEYHQALTLADEAVEKIPLLGTTSTGRLLWVAFGFSIWQPLNAPYQVSIHEWGHATRVHAMGYSFTLAPLNHPTETYDGFFPYFLAMFSHANEGGVTSWTGTPYPGVPADILNGTPGMAGMNNQMAMSEYIEDTIYHVNGHYTYLYPYIYGKLSAYSYVQATRGELNPSPGNDVVNVMNFWQTKGYAISMGDLETANLRAVFLSGTFWSLMNAGSGHINWLDPVARPLEWGPVRIPDLEAYLTTRGLSHKIKTGLRFGNWSFPIAYEQVYLGGYGEEYTLGARWANAFGLEDTTLAHTRIGTNAETLIRWRFVTLGYNLYDGMSLHGERNAISWQRGRWSDEIWARVSYRY